MSSCKSHSSKKMRAHIMKTGPFADVRASPSLPTTFWRYFIWCSLFRVAPASGKSDEVRMDSPLLILQFRWSIDQSLELHLCFFVIHRHEQEFLVAVSLLQGNGDTNKYPKTHKRVVHIQNMKRLAVHVAPPIGRRATSTKPSPRPPCVYARHNSDEPTTSPSCNSSCESWSDPSASGLNRRAESLDSASEIGTRSTSSGDYGSVREWSQKQQQLEPCLV